MEVLKEAMRLQVEKIGTALSQLRGDGGVGLSLWLFLALAVAMHVLCSQYLAFVNITLILLYTAV